MRLITAATIAVVLSSTMALSACSGPTPITTEPTTTVTGHETTTTSSGSATTLASEPNFSVIEGTYIGGTADAGSLFVRADGASRFSGPDTVACPTCVTATAPLATVDFSLTILHATGGGAQSASGSITAESDPAWAAQLGSGPPGAGPIGAALSLTVSATGTLALSFLPADDQLQKSPGN